MSRNLLQIITFYYIKYFYHPHLQKGTHIRNLACLFFAPVTLTILPTEGEGRLTSRFVRFRWKKSITTGRHRVDQFFS